MLHQHAAKVVVAAAIVLRIHHQRPDTFRFHLGKHAVQERDKGIVRRIGANIELQVANALFREIFGK